MSKIQKDRINTGTISFISLNGRNFHGNEALLKCIKGVIADGNRVLLINIGEQDQEKIIKEFGMNVSFL